MMEFASRVAERLRELFQAALDESQSFAELSGAYDELEREAGETLKGDALLPVRRAIAGNRLTIALVCKQPVRTCQPLFERVLAMGFEDAEDKLLQVGAYCRYCVRTGDASVAKRHLSDALQEARKVFEPKILEPYEDLLKKI